MDEFQLHFYNSETGEWKHWANQDFYKKDFVDKFPKILPSNYTLEDRSDGHVSETPVDENGKVMPFFDPTCVCYF